MTRDKAANMGIRFLKNGMLMNEVVDKIQKLGGVSSTRLNKQLSKEGVRHFLTLKFSEVKKPKDSETIESLQEKLFQTRLSSAFTDVNIALLKKSKEHFRYEEVKNVLNEVQARL